MKQMRILFLILALGAGLGAQRAQGQTAAQTMTFSIICQYVTNTYTTNVDRTVLTNQHILTVVINSANIVRAIIADTFWNSNSTDFQTNLAKWGPASLVYEENMTNHNQGIFLRYMGQQTNVSRYFTSSFSTNGYANMFAHDVTNAFVGTIFPTVSTNGYADVFSEDVTNNYADNDFPTNTLPLSGLYGFGNGPAGLGYDNLAYLTLFTKNTSFSLFGYSQGTLLNVVYDLEGNVGKVDKALVVGAGTFSLNLNTNYLFLTNPFTNYYYLPGHRLTNDVLTNSIPATNYVGLAHGTLLLAPPYHINIGPPEGP
jgi:hypothetical protein